MHALTPQDVLIAGLEELVRKSHREELRLLAGKVRLEFASKRSRKSRTP